MIVSILYASISQCNVNLSLDMIYQLRILNENLTLREFKTKGLEICTIDRFQGRDKPVIILSLVRSNEEGKAGRLLQDFRRLNVAFSRAKKKMVMIGSFSTLYRGSDIMQPVLELIEERNWVHKLSNLS